MSGLEPLIAMMAASAPAAGATAATATGSAMGLTGINALLAGEAAAGGLGGLGSLGAAGLLGKGLNNVSGAVSRNPQLLGLLDQNKSPRPELLPMPQGQLPQPTPTLHDQIYGNPKPPMTEEERKRLLAQLGGRYG